jgi:hypothetical protein
MSAAGIESLPDEKDLLIPQRIHRIRARCLYGLKTHSYQRNGQREQSRQDE